MPIGHMTPLDQRRVKCFVVAVYLVLHGCIDNGAAISALSDYAGVLPLNIVGSQSATPIMQTWAKGYKFSDPFADVTYTTATDPVPIFTAPDTPYLLGVVDDYDTANLPVYIFLFPFTAFSISLPVRLDGINGESVVLDMETIGGIYLGSVTFWDDVAIAALNGNLTLPHTPIRPIVYSSSFPATGVFSQALAEVVEGWNTTVTPPISSNATYPITNSANTLVCNSTAPDAFLDLLLSQDGSIGYVLSSDFLYQGLSLAQQVFIKRNQTIVAPTSESVSAAMVSFNDALIAQLESNGPIVNSPDDSAWPFSSMLYAAVNFISVASRCQAQISASTFFTWTQINTEAVTDLVNLGYAPLSLAVRNKAQNNGAGTSCNGQYVLTESVVIGMGTVFQQDIMESWARIYSSTQGAGTTFINYYTTSQSTTNAAIVDFSIKFALTGDIYAASIFEAASDIMQFPAFAYGIAISYNVPALTNQPPLILTVDMIAAIFNNDIIFWNDPRIVTLNQNPVYCNPSNSCIDTTLLPNQPIMIINRIDPSTTTLVFTKTLNAMAPSYSIQPTNNITWPLPSAQVVNTVSTAALPVLVNTPNSLTYMPNIWIAGDPTATSLGNARIVNRQNNAVGPNQANVLAAVEEFGIQEYRPKIASRVRNTTPPSLVGNLTAGNGKDSYPFSSYLYLAIRTSSSDSNCPSLTRFLDFVLWTQSYTAAKNAVAAFGGTALPSDIGTQVLETLAQLVCNNTRALAIAGCLTSGGTICSEHGGCVNGACLCTPGYSGRYCESSGNSDNNAVIFIAIFTTVIPLLLCVCCIIVIAVIIAIIFGRQGDRAWAVEFSDIELKQQIGAGGYGTVHKAIWKDSDVAVKLLTNSGPLTREMKKNFVSEVKVMTQLRHPNVVLFMGACTKPPNLCIIMEYMELGSLYDVLHNELVPTLPMSLKIKLALQAAQGMHFLHSSGILHRDLKSPNILLDDKWNAKISDFGLTKFKQDSGSDIDKLAGSLFWTAPEILGEEMPFGEASDVYSFGIILWELLTEKDPYEGMNPTTVAVCVLRDDMRPKLPQSASIDYTGLIENCWDRQIDVRPTFLEAVTRLKAMASSTSSGESAHSSRQNLTSINSMDGSSSPFEHNTSSSGSDEGNAAKLGALDKAARAPSGEVCIVFTDIHRAGALWEFDPAAMKQATILHNDLLRQAMRETSGYEASQNQITANDTSEGSFCVVFQKLVDAIRWCVIVQERLVKAEWPESLLAHPAAAEELAGEDDELIFRGVRVKMGIHLGSPRMVRDPMTRRIEYIGAMVDKAAHIAAIAHGGQILATSTFYKASKKADQDIRNYVSFIMATNTEQEKAVYEMRITSLKGRFFGGVSSKALRRSDSLSQGRIKPFSSLTMSTSDSSEPSEEVGNSHKMNILSSANMCRWVIDYEDVKLGRQVGMGSYGMVYKARWKAVDVAVKRLVKQKLSERQLLDFRAEVAFLSEMHHPNIVLFIGACVKQPNLCIVTEYVKQGSLKDILMNKSIKLSWEMRMKIAKGAALGVYYLHSLDPIIMHRDLKSSNILIDENWNAKVADFGFARIKQDNATMTRCGSPCWTAPEVISGQKYTEKADVYSFGIILWEILTRQQPYKGLNYMNVGLEVVQGTRPKMPNNAPTKFAKLITRCWREASTKRPSMEKVVAYFDREADASGSINSSERDNDDEVDDTHEAA